MRFNYHRGDVNVSSPMGSEVLIRKESWRIHDSPLELVVINHGREPTFVREHLDQRGHLKITAVKERETRSVIR